MTVGYPLPASPRVCRSGRQRRIFAVVIRNEAPLWDRCSGCNQAVVLTLYMRSAYTICAAHAIRHIILARYLAGMDRDRGIDKHLPLRRVEFHILLSLAAGERHGYGIIHDIATRAETSVPDVGTMYRARASMLES